MNQKSHYDTLSAAISGLKDRGYTLDFNLSKDQLHCKDPDLNLSIEHFQIDEFHRFEGDSNPDDMSIIYAISSLEGHKGVLVSAFGTYADSVSAAMLLKLKV